MVAVVGVVVADDVDIDTGGEFPFASLMIDEGNTDEFPLPLSSTTPTTDGRPVTLGLLTVFTESSGSTSANNVAKAVASSRLGASSVGGDTSRSISREVGGGDIVQESPPWDGGGGGGVALWLKRDFKDGTSNMGSEGGLGESSFTGDEISME